ncbi:amino acid ABC transporter substrate-binding protein [Labrys sp. KB_33_2]|uniref:amino acid ABC transporter substrate-binding protein n=1 Tax=Labrys sp. KB_33_2 TaxID=3237479 RepID=UPI003F8DD4F4
MNKLIPLTFAIVMAAIGIARAEDMIGEDLSAAPKQQYFPLELSGTLLKANSTGAITIGYRDASFPFSFKRPDQAGPEGYAIELCKGVVEEISRELHDKPVRIDYKLVTSDTRIEAVTSGEADLECGSTTANLERQKSVSFSPITYVAGTKLLVKRDSGIHTYKDLHGKTLVVTAGTTNEAALKQLNDKYKLGMIIASAPDHQQSYDMLAAGKADAFATDDALLYGFIARNHAQKSLAVVGDFITYDAYGIMFRREDPLMAEAVRRAFATMAEQGKLVRTYRRWFLQPTPTGENLNLPISLQLTEAWRALGIDEF